MRGMPHALSEFRTRMGLSKAAIAARAKTSRQTIHRIEALKQMPSMALVRRLVDATDGVLRADDFMPPAKSANGDDGDG
jgi:DNA-binding XRE family transcriptional regulator